MDREMTIGESINEVFNADFFSVKSAKDEKESEKKENVKKGSS